jgi:3-oxoacyl-[acyl-carrier-protein] synthase II
MGAASAIEACACVLMLNHNIMLPTINYAEPDPECDIDCVPNTAREAELNIIVSNAYAFAGNCSSLVLKKFKG